jgi:hypothetical protein
MRLLQATSDSPPHGIFWKYFRNKGILITTNVILDQQKQLAKIGRSLDVAGRQAQGLKLLMVKRHGGVGMVKQLFTFCHENCAISVRLNH